MGLTNFPNGIQTNQIVIDDAVYNSGWRVAVHDAVFAGGTTNARGDFDGTGNPTTLFEVTGAVLAVIFGVCSVDLTGASATLAVGVANNTAALIAQTTATDIDAGEIWRDATPAVGAETLNDPLVVVDDIIETVGTANITAGAIRYYCLWQPISADGNVVAA